MTTPVQTQIEALIKALEPFAKIEIPPNASDGTWVARTLFCNNQITAYQVRQARAACNAKTAFDAAAAEAGAMRAFGASDLACYKWPEDTLEHKALRAAFVEGAALTAAAEVETPYQRELRLTPGLRSAAEVGGKVGQVVPPQVKTGLTLWERIRRHLPNSRITDLRAIERRRR